MNWILSALRADAHDGPFLAADPAVARPKPTCASKTPQDNRTRGIKTIKFEDAECEVDFVCIGTNRAIVLAFFEFVVVTTHFWPFTNVLRKISRRVTRKVQKLKNHGFETRSFSQLARRYP